MDVCRSKIHHDQFHTNAEGTLSWEEVECLGACVNAPMVMIFKDTYEDLTPERLGEIIDAFDAGKGGSVPAGPQIDRIVSAPQSGLTTLRDEKAVLKIDARQGSREAAAASRRRQPRRRRSRRRAAVECRQAEDRCGRDQRGDQVAVRGQGRAGGREAASVSAADAATRTKPPNRLKRLRNSQRPTQPLPRRRSTPAGAPAPRPAQGCGAGQAVARRPEPPGRHRKAGQARRSQADLRRRPEDRGHPAFARHLHLRAGRVVAEGRARLGRRLPELQGPHRA